MIRATIATLLVALVIAQTTTTIDATGETRQFTREIVGGGGGNIDRPFHIDLQAVLVNAGSQSDDFILMDFIVTNRGKEPLTLPIDLHPRDFQPAGGEPSTFKRLSLFLTIGASPASFVLSGGNLYGSANLPATLHTLLPSESLLVHTKCSLKYVRRLSGPQMLIPRAMLYDETLTPKGAGMESFSNSIGSAKAPSLLWTPETKK
jgi:hypothetical protein